MYNYVFMYTGGDLMPSIKQLYKYTTGYNCRMIQQLSEEAGCLTVMHIPHNKAMWQLWHSLVTWILHQFLFRHKNMVTWSLKDTVCRKSKLHQMQSNLIYHIYNYAYYAYIL